ncbi:MAG TPA: hypothetical protein VHC18_22375 [Amycolatopsis sp.]|nr:hypothetical protein [Amycolatopsis sp.]
MRTTVHLPDELLRAAKAEAAARGETLKDLLTRAVTHELGSVGPSAERARVQLPLVGTPGARKVDLSNAEIEAIFAAEDAEKYGNH